MIATDDRPVNGHTVNGHGHTWAPFQPIPELGPTEPLTQPLPAVVDPSEATEPQPEPAAEHTELTEVAPQTPAREPELPPLPELPDKPSFNVDKEYWGHKALVGVYWIAILTGAIGQVVFFGSLFGLGVWGFVAAGVIATTAETVMVSAGDTALKHRVQDSDNTRRWLPFLLVSFAAAAAASGMNLSHFWHINISLAVLFGGVSLLGYLLHILDGFVKGSGYLDRKKTYDEAVERRQAEERQRAEATYERQLADWETHRQAATRAVTQAEPVTDTKPKEPAVKRSKPKVSSASAKSAKAERKGPKPSRDEVLAYARETGGSGYQAHRHFTELGYHLPEATARTWVKEAQG